MNGPEIISQARDELAAALHSRGIVAQPSSLDISPWLAMSLLQKAIRRGQEGYALWAAATLLRDSPERLWRRLGLIAFEDIGVADPEVPYLATAAVTGKQYRKELGGEWAVANFLTSRLALAPKCRSADDLRFVTSAHPSLAQARIDFAFLSTPELLSIVTSSRPLPERALALWYAIGTQRCFAEGLLKRKGEPGPVFDALCEAGLPHTAVEIAREGFRKSGEVLCPLVALLCPERQAATTTVMNDEVPEPVLIGGVPSWAFDMYSREGRRGLAHFLGSEAETAKWVRSHIPVSQQVRFLGNIVFAVEGSILRPRMRWPIADQLRHQAEVECHGRHCPDATDVLELMRAELPLLEEARRHVA